MSGCRAVVGFAISCACVCAGARSASRVATSDPCESEAWERGDPVPFAADRAVRREAGLGIPRRMHREGRGAARRSGGGRTIPCFRSVAQIRRLALSLLDFINIHFHSVFLPRVAPAWIATASRAASLPRPSSDPSGWCFYGLYSLLSRSATSSLRECKEVLDAILEFAFGVNGGANGGDIASLAFLTRCLSCAPYGCWEEVLHVITSVNLRVYLSINQSEAFDILQTQARDLDHTARSGGRPGELRGATLRRDRGAVEMRGLGEGKIPADSGGGGEIRGMLCADYSLDSHAGS